MSDLPYVKLGRNVSDELDGENYAEFVGEWSPEEPEGWEEFRVMLLGMEAGDYEPATWDDLRAILEARERLER